MTLGRKWEGTKQLYLPKTAYQSELKGRSRLCFSNLLFSGVQKERNGKMEIKLEINSRAQIATENQEKYQEIKVGRQYQ